MKRGRIGRVAGTMLLVAVLALAFAAYTRPDFVFELENLWALCT